MRIMQVYSNQENFKTIQFNEGLNIILGKITKKYDRSKDTHNLGKTTLIHIIDFLLLKDISGNRNHIFKKNYSLFSDYTFFLEIKLNSGKYLTIKRSVSNSNKASLKLHNCKYQNFINENNWDYEDLSLYSKFPEKNAKNVLNNLLGFNVLEKYDYRKSINYFLRAQADYTDVFHLSKFRGRDKDWKPFLFRLLGFDDCYLIKKYELDDKYNQQKKLSEEISSKFSVDINEVDRINGLIDLKNREKQKLSKYIDEFDFYLKEKNISKEIVEELETKISELNTLAYTLRFDIKRIGESLNVKTQFNLKEIEEIFKEVKIYFPNQLKRTYEELLEFNNEITNERNKYLKETLFKKENQLKDVEKKLVDLNNERKSKLSFLKEKDSFKKFKNYQKELVKIEKEISDLKAYIDKIDIVKNINEQQNKIKDEIDTLTARIKEQIENSNDNYRNIRLLFSELINHIINKTGLLSIKLNSNGNVTFNIDIQDDLSGKLTSQGEGNTYKKLLCVCFDLTLLIHYSKKSFYRFAYHDGSLESLDDRKKLNYLELLDEICEKHDLQVIVTMIEDDIPVYDNGERYEFKDGQIVLELSDKDDDSGRLFGFSF